MCSALFSISCTLASAIALQAQPNYGMAKDYGQWMQCADNTSLRQSVFTVECWLKAESRIVIVSRDQPGNALPDWSLVYDAAGKRLEFMTGMNSQPDEYFHTPYNSFPHAAWAHAAVVVNGTAGTVRMYINGALASAHNFAPRSFVVQTGLAWGGYYNNAGGAAGAARMDECRYWNHERLLPQIQSFMNMPLPWSSRSGLMGYWLFCGNFADSSGNGNHMQPIGNLPIVLLPDLPVGVWCREDPPAIAARSMEFTALCPRDVPRDSIVWIGNPGGSPLTVKSANIQGPDAAVFSLLAPIITPSGLLIQPHDSAAFTLRFQPSSYGVYEAGLYLLSNAKPDSIYRTALRGSWQLAAISASGVDFGGNTAGAFPRDTMVAIHNTGTAAVTISAIYGSSPWFAVISGLPVTIQPGGRAEIGVRFMKPPGRGVFSDSLRIIHSPSCEDSKFEVRGTRNDSGRLAAPDSIVLLRVSCEPSSFDTTLHLFNRSTSPVTIFRYSAYPNAVLSVISPSVMPVTIPAGDSLEILLRVIPGGFGELGGKLMFFSDAPDYPDVTIRIQALIARILLQATSVEFGDIESGPFPHIGFLRITNNSPGPVTVTGASLNPSSPFRVLWGIPVTIQPNATALVQVAFDDPGLPGDFRDSLFLHYHPPCDSLIAMIHARRVFQAEADYPSELQVFPPPCERGPVDTVVTIRNTGKGELAILSALIYPDSAFKLYPAPAFPVVIPPGQTAGIGIRFLASAWGGAEAELSLITNLSKNPARRIMLHGFAAYAALLVPDASFGSVDDADFPVAKKILLRNSGNVPLTVDTAFFRNTAPFKILSPFPVIIDAGEAAELILLFERAPSPGVSADSLVFRYSPPCEPAVAMVEGTRVLRTAAVSADSLALTTLSCGPEARDTAIVIVNAGSAALIITGARLEGDPAFSILPPLPASI